MNRPEKMLVLLLRLSAFVLLIAVIPVMMPYAWMQDIHRRLGMGELPHGPILGYLTRSLSAMYAMHGVVMLFVSLDVRRYMPLIKCLAVLGIVLGAGLLLLDIAVGMPAPWTICEGPVIMPFYRFVYWLTTKVQSRWSKGTPA